MSKAALRRSLFCLLSKNLLEALAQKKAFVIPAQTQLSFTDWKHRTIKYNDFWSCFSVTIKAENPDPTSSWRSLIPVIKVNISTVSAIN